MNEFFHYLANEGRAITDYRNTHPGLAHLPAYRIDVFIRLEKLRKLINSK